MVTLKRSDVSWYLLKATRPATPPPRKPITEVVCSFTYIDKKFSTTRCCLFSKSKSL